MADVHEHDVSGDLNKHRGHEDCLKQQRQYSVSEVAKRYMKNYLYHKNRVFLNGNLAKEAVAERRYEEHGKGGQSKQRREEALVGHRSRMLTRFSKTTQFVQSMLISIDANIKYYLCIHWIQW